MNLGDGLLFELEKGKPKLILLSHGEKYPAKHLSIRPRAANILSAKQPSCVEEAHGDERTTRLLAGRQREVRYKAKGAASSSTPTTTDGKSTSLTLSKTYNHHKGSVKVEAKVKPIKHAVNNNVGPQRANKKTEQPPNTGIRVGEKLGLNNTLPSRDEGLKDIVCLTNEQLQHLLNTAQTLSNGQHAPENQEPQGNETDLKCASSVKEREDGEIKEEGGGGERGIKKRGGGTDTTRSSQEKDNGVPACLFSWLEDRQSDSKAAIDARKVQWRRELDEQVALKQQQQRLAPDRLQAEEYAESVLSVQSSVSHRELPAAIRSSLRLGEITPMEDVLSVERREEQRRRWLQELDHQKEEASERRKREKLLQNQTEDHERWATHFDSLQRRPLVQAPTPSALPPVQLSGSERGEWEPSSSLSLVWEATSSCGAESVIGASVDSTGGYPRTSYLRTMTSLLDPVQIEERERRRLKQLEQQKVIEAQMEERRKQREQEEAKRRREEEEEERRVALEREMLQRQYKLETLKMKQVQAVHQVESPENGHNDGNLQETFESSKVITQSKDVEDANRSASLFKNTAVQTEAAPLLPLKADEVQIPDVGAQHHPSPSPSVAPSNSRSRGLKMGKENMCLPAGDPYEPFVRTERSRGDKRRPEWNTQRPSRRFVPASERYPVAMQKDRQESRLKRQAELLALQERTCLSRTEPSAAQHQELHLCPSTQQTRTSPAKKVETGNKGNNISTTINTDRGRSPAVPAVRHKVQSQQVSTTLHPLPPVLEFIPYVRTDEVFHLDPLEPADTPSPHTHSGAPPTSSASPPAHRDPLLHPELLRNTHTQRQQEILRGLAQLRQGLLQKQKELETDLNPLLNHHGNEQRLPSTTHRM